MSPSAEIEFYYTFSTYVLWPSSAVAVRNGQLGRADLFRKQVDSSVVSSVCCKKLRKWNFCASVDLFSFFLCHLVRFSSGTRMHNN